MSANIDTMLYVGEVPWHGLGVKYENLPNLLRRSSKELSLLGKLLLIQCTPSIIAKFLDTTPSIVQITWIFSA